MWLKNFRQRKIQTFLTAIIILLCALLLCTSLNILCSLSEPMEELSRECQSATAIIYPYATSIEETEAVADRLRDLPEIEQVICTPRHYISEKMTSNGRNITPFTNLTEYNEEMFGNIRCIEGEKENFSRLGERECVIPACVCYENGLEVGDSFEIHMPDQVYAYTIVGIYADIYSTSNAFDNYILVKEIPKGVSTQLHIRIYAEEDVTEEDIEQSYEQTYGHFLEGMLYSKDKAAESSLLAVQLTGGMLLALGAIMLLTSCLIINYMVRNMLTADAKTIAIYKTIGYDYATIRNMYVKFYAAITTAAVVSGILLSKFVSDRILQDLFENIGIEADTTIFKTGTVIFFINLCLILLTVYIVTAKMKKVKPIFALAGMSPTDTTKIQKYRGSYGFAFSPIGIALRIIMRDKKGTLGILITAIVSVIGINFALISLDVANAMKANNDYWLGIDKCDVSISIADGATVQDIEKALKGDPNIEKAIPCRMNGMLVARGTGSIAEEIYPFVYDNYNEIEISIVEGRNPENGEEIALAGKIAETMQKDIGDYIELEFEQESRSFLITGLYQTYYNVGASCRLTTDAYADSSFVYDTVSIYLKDNSNIEKEVERIAQIVGGNGEVIPRTEKFAPIMEMISKPQEDAIPAVMLMAVLIGSLNIFCIIMLKNNKDTKINGIYKCMGYTTAHLMIANMFYVSLLAIVSILIALPIILYFYPTIMKLALGMMFGLLEYRVKYNMTHVMVGNLVIFAFFIVSTFISSTGIRKVNVRDLVID